MKLILHVKGDHCLGDCYPNTLQIRGKKRNIAGNITVNMVQIIVKM